MKTTLTALLTFAALHIGALADDAMSKLDEERLDQSGTVITIIFDDSGSMAGEKMAQAKAAFRDWLATVPDTYRIGLIALNGGTLVKWNRGNKSEVADAVARIQVNGATPLADVIQNVMAEIKKRQKLLPFERHVLVVFTDGEDSTNRGVDGVREELFNASRNLVETVGIGFHGQGDYMSDVATRYFDAGSTEELRRGLEKVDSEIGNTSDIVIDDSTLQAMKTVKASSFRPAPPAPTSDASTTSTVSRSRHSSSASPVFVFIFAIFVVIAVLPQVLKAFK